jgi:hypothetical protein
MARAALLSLLVAFVMAACGGGAPAGAGSSQAAAPAGGGDLPGLSNVIFGTGYDPATLAVIGKAGSLKAGTPIVAVGRTLAARSPAEVSVQISSGGIRFPARPVTASVNPDSSDTFAADLSADNLAAGTWIVSFISPKGSILASGTLMVTP